MGSKSSKILGDEVMENYMELTYLKRSEILCIQNIFWTLGSNYLEANLQCRFPFLAVLAIFPEFKVNPFRERLFKVFSSLHDEHLSFEDVLDLFSVLSENCPDKVKAAWAFKVFDFDEDGIISPDDIKNTIDMLTGPRNNHSATNFSNDEKEEIVQAVLREIDMDETMVVTKLEFIHAVLKMPDFAGCFRLKL